MKTVTTREAQHHLSKVLEMVGKGEEVIITRRGEAVAKLSSVKAGESHDARVDWSKSIQHRDENLSDIPQLQRNVIVEMREEERY
jgi:prevent-host-death family protein